MLNFATETMKKVKSLGVSIDQAKVLVASEQPELAVQRIAELASQVVDLRGEVEQLVKRLGELDRLFRRLIEAADEESVSSLPIKEVEAAGLLAADAIRDKLGLPY